MKYHFIKKVLIATTLCACYNVSFADTQTTNSPNTNAIAFANEAGAIAGVAQACGEDISVFITRTNEALEKLATNASDKILATQNFQNALQKAQATENEKHSIACQQAKQAYNNLPILRNDYKESVLSQLSPTMGNNAQNNNATSPNPSNNNANTSTTSQPFIANPPVANNSNIQSNLNNQATNNQQYVTSQNNSSSSTNNLSPTNSLNNTNNNVNSMQSMPTNQPSNMVSNAVPNGATNSQ